MVQVVEVGDRQRRSLIELVLNGETVLVLDVVGEVLPSDGAEIDPEEVDPLDF